MPIYGRKLSVMREFVSFTNISYYSLAGCVAIEQMGGPHIEWTGGRRDKGNETDCPPQGRLPDAALGKDHVLDVFVSRMGFTVRETVALIGAHTVGRCHADRSGIVLVIMKADKMELNNI
jgi:catalase (peroxidase I)